jgi:predicted pyridoxine 5'-phosphate oxidase superfamily flavin-nucleotide-binding protein
MIMSEKRIFPRLALHIPVIIDDNEEVEMKNISIGGFCLITRRSILKGSNVSCKFTIPGNKEITSRGKIAWSLKKSNNKYECGIDIENITVNDYETVRRYINRESRNY